MLLNILSAALPFIGAAAFAQFYKKDQKNDPQAKRFLYITVLTAAAFILVIVVRLILVLAK